jgi:hypothetical protein
MSKSSGKHAFGYCDRTGFRYPLKDLVRQYENKRWNGMMVGRDMVDKDHPQLRLGEVNASDDQSLANPRPDKEITESRGLSAFDPVGGGITVLGSRTVGLDIKTEVGRITVT